MRARLSIMWVFLVLNYIYCDVFTAMAAIAGTDADKQLQSVHPGGMQFAPGLFLGMAALMEIPMLMVLLARYLPFKANRWTNIATGLFMAAVEAASLFVGAPPAFYIFFATIEIAGALLIFWFAWKWKDSEAAAPVSNSSRPE